MGKVFAFLTLIVVGYIIAGALIHPVGVKALGGVANTGWKTTSNALLGKTS